MLSTFLNCLGIILINVFSISLCSNALLQSDDVSTD